MVPESWFHTLLKTPRKRKASPQKALVGVLTFEVASLMSKLIHLWRFLSDGQISKLREEVSNSVGLKKLVSDDDEYIVSLICGELLQNLTHLAKSVARLGRKCSDPSLKSFEQFFSDFIENGNSNTPYGWLFSFKKMERKVKKMERFISVAASLYQETETLSDLEQTLRRMRGNEDLDKVNIVEFQKKVARKRQDLKNLRELSLWNRTYDYTVFFLARSLFTVHIRIKHVFGIEEMVDGIPQSQSVAALMQSFLAPTKNGVARFASGPLRKSNIKSGKFSKGSNFFSGSLSGSLTVSGPLSSNSSRKDQNFNFYSGPLRKASVKSGLISETDKNGKNLWPSSFLGPYGNSKKLHSKPNRPTQVEPLKGPAISSYRSPTIGRQLNFHTEILNRARDSNSDLDPRSNADLSEALLNFKCRLFDAPPETLGATALSLHYANVIIVIEKLAASPHLIAPDARDDLYDMLPATIRTSLRARLKPFSKGLTASIYDTVLAAEWREAMMGILDWLLPLAHNTIRWQSERSFEQQNIVSKTNVLLVQTLYFANQEKMEAIIAELLVGLNYIWRFGRQLDAKALLACATGSSRIFDEYLELDG